MHINTSVSRFSKKITSLSPPAFVSFTSPHTYNHEAKYLEFIFYSETKLIKRSNDHNHRNKISKSYTLNPLHNDSSSSPTTITNSRYTILTYFKLVEEGGEDSGSGRTEGVAEGDGAAEGVHTGVLEVEDLCGVSDVSQTSNRKESGEQWLGREQERKSCLLICLNDSSKCLVKFPYCDILLFDACSLQRNRNSLRRRNGAVNRINCRICVSANLSQ